VGRVLGDEVQFFDATRDQLAGFGHHVRRRTAPMRTAHARDGAKAARMIAALGDFHVGKMTRREAEARRRVVRAGLGARMDRDLGRRGRKRPSNRLWILEPWTLNLGL